MNRLGTKRDEKARTSLTFGLFSSPLRGLAGLCVLLLISCGGGPTPAPTPEPSADLPAITGPGDLVDSDIVSRVARLVTEARGALERGDWGQAIELSTSIIEDFSEVPGSSEALWIRARAALEDGSMELASASALRFVEVLPSGHPLSGRARLVAARGQIAASDQGTGVRTLLRIDSGAPDDVRSQALDLVRSSIQELGFSELRSLAGELPSDGWSPLSGPVLARHAEELYIRGRTDEGESAAEAALAAMESLPAGMDGTPEIELARAVLEGRVENEWRGQMVLGGLLPESGSPSERQYSALIREGILARVDARDPDAPLSVQLQLRDDRGSVTVLPGLMGELNGLGTLGIVGPLTNAMMDAAIDARGDAIPMISPTVQPVPEDATGIYSLNGLDPGGAELLARFARSRGLETAVVLHAGTVEHSFEADVFGEEFGALGGTILRSISYPPGSTFFEEHLAMVQELRPEALVLPVPSSDIELLAPQLTYFGLDTLGVRVFGTESWGEPEIREGGDPRHLNGIVVATPRPDGGEMPGWSDFVEDYEGVHLQTLRSRVPALGYDAAGLLIEAASYGAADARDVRASLEEIQDFPGATGFLSLVDGEIRRRYHLVRLRENEVIPLVLETMDRGSAP